MPTLHIRDYMSSAPVAFEAEQPLREAKLRMYELGVRHLPVVSRQRLVGILSHRDITLAESLGQVDDDFPVSRAMQPDPFSVGPDALLHAVAEEMAEHKYGTAVVVDPEHPQKLIGIFTTIDALRALSDLAKN